MNQADERGTRDASTEEHARDLEFLARAALDLVELPPDQDILSFAGRRLHELIEDSVVSVSRYHPESRTLSLHGIFGAGALLEKVFRMLGTVPQGLTFRMSDAALSALTSRRLVEVPGGLYEVTLDRFPAAVIREIERVAGVTSVHAMGFSWQGRLFGSAVMVLRGTTRLPRRLLVEAFINQAAVALQRRQAEDGLRQERSRFATVMESTPLVVLAGLDREGVIHHWNGACEQVCGVGAAEAVGRRVDELALLGTNVGEFLELLGEVWRSGRAAPPGERRIHTRHGDERWLYTTVFPILEQGAVTEVFCMGVDITERRRAEEALRDSEQRFRELADLLPQTVFECDAEGRLTFMNLHGLASIWLGREEALGIDVVDLLLPGDRTAARARLAGVLQGERILGDEYTRLRPDGSTFPVAVYVSAVMRGGRAVGARGIAIDMTERKRAEEALRESEQRFRELVDLLPQGVIESDTEGRITFANQRTLQMIGYEPEDVAAGIQVPELVVPADRERLLRNMRTIVEGGPAVGHEYTMVRRDGSTFDVEVYASRIERGGKLVGLRAVGFDITERKRAEEALRESERRFRELVDLLPQAVIECDLEGRFTFANQHALKMSGYGANDLAAGLYLIEAVSPADRDRFRRNLQELFGGAPTAGHEYTIVRPDGSAFEVEVHATRVERGGQPVGLRAVGFDVTARKRAEEALRESERRFRELADLLPQSVFECDARGRMTFANRHAFETTGYPLAELAGSGVDLAKMAAPGDRERARQRVDAVLAGGSISGEEFTGVRKDGGTFEVAVFANPIVRGGAVAGLRGIAVDLTERKRAEEQRRQLEAQVQHAQKLESLGVLAGGIAHDFNNLLVGILGNAELALTDLGRTSPARTRIERVKAAAERAADLTTQMLAYSGRGRLAMEALDLNDVLDEMADLLHASVSKQAIVRRELGRDLPLVEGDATQVRQVAMNLIINASDALEERPGVITVRTGVAREDRGSLADAHCAEDLVPGEFVVLEVSDTGCGMDEATRARIFDPFFTTKFAGRGLGLAAVLGIVRGHRGAIQVRSTPGRGTTFRVLLPALARRAVAAPPPRPAAGAWQGSGTVLVVDDEEMMREVASAVLEQAGFTVLTAADGREGIAVLREHREEIVAVLLDLTMPTMSGEEAFQEMRRMVPDLPIILASGYSTQDLARRFAGKGLSAAIQKPFDIETMIGKFREVLERARRTGA